MIFLHIYQNDQNDSTYQNHSKPQNSKELLFNNLSHYLKKPKAEIKLYKNANGKPKTQGVEFSISHSQNTLVQGFCLTTKIGVDVEFIDSTRNVLSLAKRYFHKQEVKHLLALDEIEQVQHFYWLWTRKEALCKLQGGRLWYYLKTNVLNPNLTLDGSNDTVVIESYDKISGFSLSVASYQKKDEANPIQFVFETDREIFDK